MNFLYRRQIKLSIYSQYISSLTENHRILSLNRRIDCFTKTNSNQIAIRHSSTANLLVFGQIAPVIGLIVGRVIQRRWPHLRHVNVYKSLSEHRLKVGTTVGLVGAACATIINRYTEETPLTGRRRFIMFSKKDYEPISEMMFKIIYQTFKHKILPVEHRTSRKVHNIVKKLLESNKDLEEIWHKKWSIYVISDTQTANAFVLPTGHIFVYTGIIRLCDNDDQLASILAHELSHTLLSHGKEVLTQEFALDLVQAMMTMFLWIRFSTIPALVTTIITSFGLKGMFLLPKRRQIETEADVIGLTLTAKACFDVREASAFWMKMAALEDRPTVSELSTHPSNSSRYELMDSCMESMIELMECHNCPKISPTDPRDVVRKRFGEVDRSIEIKVK